jgi:hypothetical protein
VQPSIVPEIVAVDLPTGLSGAYPPISRREERAMPDNQFWRDASGRLTFEMFRARADSYPAICEAVERTFGLVPHTALVTNGCDIMFIDYHRGDQVVGLEWDTWSGFTVVAKIPDAESLVQDIAAWLLQSEWAGEGKNLL